MSKPFFLKYFRKIAVIALWILLLSKIRPLDAKSRKYSVDFKGVDSFLQTRALKDSSNLIRYKKTTLDL